MSFALIVWFFASCGIYDCFAYLRWLFTFPFLFLSAVSCNKFINININLDCSATIFPIKSDNLKSSYLWRISSVLCGGSSFFFFFFKVLLLFFPFAEFLKAEMWKFKISKRIMTIPVASTKLLLKNNFLKSQNLNF